MFNIVKGIPISIFLYAFANLLSLVIENSLIKTHWTDIQNLTIINLLYYKPLPINHNCLAIQALAYNIYINPLRPELFFKSDLEQQLAYIQSPHFKPVAKRPQQRMLQNYTRRKQNMYPTCHVRF